VHGAWFVIVIIGVEVGEAKAVEVQVQCGGTVVGDEAPVGDGVR
jgi:hypothetical protein